MFDSMRGYWRESDRGARRKARRLRPDGADGLERRELLTTVIVDGRANIYGAGLGVAPGPGGGGGGLLPVKIELATLGSPKAVAVPTATGWVSGWAGGPDPYNGPDGGPYWGGVTNVPAYGGISGVLDTRATMFLVGVFLGPAGQPAKPPATPDVTGANGVTSFSPLIGQQFFIGDGHTAARALQTFNVPAGATKLFLGFAEGFRFGNPRTLPGYYNDNGGKLTVDVVPAVRALAAHAPGQGGDVAASAPLSQAGVAAPAVSPKALGARTPRPTAGLFTAARPLKTSAAVAAGQTGDGRLSRGNSI